MAALERIKVLMCYDNPVLRAGLMAILARHADLDCTEGVAALIVGPTAMPDVIVADHHGGVGLVNATGKMRSLHASPRMLILSHSARECDIREALSSGVQGYLLVDDAPEHLAAAIRSVRSGGRALSPKVASRLAENVALEPLTQREEAVLVLVVEGLCNKSIASRLGITAGTVKSHLRSAFGKIGAASRTQAVAIANRRGLLHLRTAAVGVADVHRDLNKRTDEQAIGTSHPPDAAAWRWPPGPQQQAAATCQLS